jgi:hypothetical protein
MGRTSDAKERLIADTCAKQSIQPGQLTLLTNPPLGVKRATNPFAATGASDPEAGDAARAKDRRLDTRHHDAHGSPSNVHRNHRIRLFHDFAGDRARTLEEHFVRKENCWN